jgi:type I restriction enzyme, R subunit
LAWHPRVFLSCRATWSYRNTQAQGQRRHVQIFRRAGLCVFAQGRHKRWLPSPFKEKQISTTLDEYVYTLDDRLIEGEVETGRRYTERDFNTTIEIKEREAYRVKLFMEMIDQREKTLVFCATQHHALAVRDLINQMKTGREPDYCVRVTADDGARGEQYLRDFQDNEKSIPAILTTSQKLSTGVDARNVRNIVLTRTINSMIEFKQIIGRGTRLYEEKDYFTIYDFVRAHHHFSDPEWDGDPIDSEPVRRNAGIEPAGSFREDPVPRPHKIRVKLADGKERTIQHMVCYHVLESGWKTNVSRAVFGKPLRHVTGVFQK